MDRVRLKRVLSDLRQERTETEHQLAALQAHVDALRKAADGIEELLTSEPSATQGEPVTEAAEATLAHASASADADQPFGGPAAKMVLQSDPSRFWTVREVWDEQVRRGWAQPTDDARAAIRVALTRLRKRDPRVQFIDGPTHAYRWTADQPTEELALSNGSGTSHGGEATV